jgi:hypothetical protein
MENQEIKQIIESASTIIYHTENEIIEDRVHEQTISARLMFHLQHLLPEWNVDVEFNRQGDDRVPKIDAKGKKRKPDIIIHKRGPDGPNLAVILIKCEWNIESREKDQIAAQSIKEKHGYQTAFLLEIKQSGFQLIEV